MDMLCSLLHGREPILDMFLIRTTQQLRAKLQAIGKQKGLKERAVQRKEHTDSVPPGIWWQVPTVLSICHMTDHVCTAHCKCPGKGIPEEEGSRMNVKV